MFKKLLAGLTAVVLGLGMVALTAAPASAHHNTITATVACNTGPEGLWKVTWSVQNSEGIQETITASSDTSLVPIDTVIPGGQTATFVEYHSVKPVANKTLTLSAKWTNNNTNTSNGTVYPSSFSDDCVPDEEVTPASPTFTPAQCVDGSATSPSYTIPTTTGVVYSVQINGTGGYTDTSANTYPVPAGTTVEVKATAANGYELTGTQEWSTTFASVNCRVIPTEPTWTEAVCTGEGQVGPSVFTIPAIEGVKYQLRVGLLDWDDVAAGSHSIVDGTLVGIRALPLPGYEFPGLQVRLYGHLFDNIDLKYECLVPKAPTFDQQVCDAPGQPSTAGYTIPSDEGVKYQIRINGAWVPIAAGHYDVDAFPTTVKIRAVEKSGYHFLDGAEKKWTEEFTSAGDCLVEAPVTPATAVDQECVVGQNDVGTLVSGYLVIPATTGVDYFIGGVAAAAGQHDRDPGTYTVTAVAQSGYALTGYTGPWELEIKAAELCGDLVVLPQVTPVATFQQTTCSASASYTLGVEEPGLEDGVVWSVSGGLPATLGTHAVTSPGTVTISATPASGYGFPGDEPFREWTFEVAGLPDDCLPTLALTGSDITTGVLAVAGLLTLGGALVVAARKRGVPTQE